MNTDRYIVREVRGIGLGAGGFEVVDTLVGRTFGVTIWRDGAELLAARCNAMDQAVLAADDEPASQMLMVNRTAVAMRVDRKDGVDGQPTQLVILPLQAAARGEPPAEGDTTGHE